MLDKLIGPFLHIVHFSHMTDLPVEPTHDLYVQVAFINLATLSSLMLRPEVIEIQCGPFGAQRGHAGIDTGRLW